MLTGRSLLSLVVADKFLYAIGGLVKLSGGSNNIKPTQIVEKYDCSANLWTSVSKMITPRSAMAATFFKNYIYVMGGATKLNASETATVERFDVQTEEWSMVKFIDLNSEN